MKTLRTAGMVIGAVALIATGVGALAGAGVLGAAAVGSAGVVAGVSVGTISAIGTFGGLAAAAISAVAAASAPGASSEGSASTFTTNPQSGLPYAMGRTRMSGLRCYARTYDGFKQQSRDDILAFVALLSIAGPIQEIEQFTADNELVAFAASGDATGRFSGYMGQKVSLGTTGSALALNYGGKPFPGWTGAHKLSGLAHAQWALRYDTKAELYGAGAPEPAWIGKWVKVYDPRLDSTYPGGSGACRALQENTYVWSENPGLHALTWALGRWANGKRVCGIGAPISTIRVAEFVECANVCDANAWKVGGVEWTTDSKWDTLKRILQAGGTIPTQTAAMIGCLVSAPRTAIATIESRHLHDGLSIAATKSRRDRFNTVIPRYVDEDSDWSMISGTAVTEPAYVTADKGQRTKEIDFPLVQVFAGQQAKQPAQLAAYAIVDSREAGPFTFSTGPEWIGLKTGDVVYLNVPEEGLANQPVLITRRAVDPATGKVAFAAQTETYSKHAYALGETTTPPAPFALTAPDLKPVAPLSINWNVSGTTSGEGFPALLITGESQMPSADAVFIDYRKSVADGAPEEAWTSSAILPAKNAVSHVIAPLESMTRYDVRIGYRVGTIDGDTTLFLRLLTGLGKLTAIEGDLVLQDQQAKEALDGVRVGLALTALEAIRNGTFRINEETREAGYIRVLDQLGVKVGDVATYISFLREVDPNGNAQWALTAENSNGAITGIRSLLTGEGIGKFSIAADIVEMIDPNGGNPRRPFYYGLDNILRVRDLLVDGDLLLTGSIKRIAIGAGEITNSGRFTAADVMIPATETTLIETPFFAVGDELYGVGVAVVSFVQDAGTVKDSAAIIRGYIDTGSGYTLVRQRIHGIRTNGGDTYWSLPGSFPIAFNSTTPMRLKITAQGTQFAGGGNDSGSYARDIAIDILKGAR